MQSFNVPQSIVFGENALNHLATLKGRRAMIVTGGSSMKRFGFIDQAIAALQSSDIECKVFDGVEPNPSIETVTAGAKEMSQFEPDWIVAIGGGSALDAAKIMWAFYEHPGLTLQDVLPIGSIPTLRSKAKFVAIPSTSGTASEITAFSVITDTANHIKYPVVSHEIIPDIAIVDPALPTTMPPHITAHTGMDVMTHAIEAYVSIAANSYSDPLAMESIELTYQWLQKAYNQGDDQQARYHMHNASTLAGMAFSNVSLGIVHSLAHKIGGEFGVTHGLSNAILLPYIIKYNKRATNKFELIEERLGVKCLEETIRELNRSLGIVDSFKEVAEVEISESQFNEVLERMSENAHADPCTLTNPGSPSVEDVKRIYQQAFYGEAL